MHMQVAFTTMTVGVLFDDAHIAPFEVIHMGDVNEDVIFSISCSW